MKTINTPTLNTTTLLVKDSLKTAITYEEFKQQMAKHVINGTASGPYQSEALSNYTLLNNSRLKRWDKTLKVPEDVAQLFKNFKGSQTWLVLTESWCGDAAHVLPVIHKVTQLTNHIDFKIVHRDENILLMNAFLTNGSMAIPKLIVFDNYKQEVTNDWGPAPNFVVEQTKMYKKTHGKLSPEFKKEMQNWYNNDKGQTIARELALLVK
jgi:hypothetical protein